MRAAARKSQAPEPKRQKIFQDRRDPRRWDSLEISLGFDHWRLGFLCVIGHRSFVIGHYPALSSEIAFVPGLAQPRAQ
jgi:hypothetical protein